MPRKRSKPELTLFPFLSVLCGLIAVMMLFMVTTISTRVIEAADAPPPPPLPPREELPEGEQGVEDGIDAKTYDELNQELERLSAQLARRLQERQQLERQFQELMDLLEQKKTELAIKPRDGKRTGVKLGEPDPVRVVPAQGHNITKKPIMVEVSASGYVVHTDKEQLTFPALKAGTDKPPAALKQFLDSVQKRANEVYIVLLIHPNGANAFSELTNHLLNQYRTIDIGWEPFSREWLLLPQK